MLKNILVANGSLGLRNRGPGGGEMVERARENGEKERKKKMAK